MTSRFRSLWRNLVHRDHVERDLDEEVRSVFDLVVQEKIRAGLSEKDARRAATLELGRVESVKEQVREIRAGAVLDAFLQDLRYGARMLRKSPGFTATAVLTLALGIGANTAIFSVVNSVLLEPLPYRDADRLVQPLQGTPTERMSGGPTRITSINVPELAAIRARTETLSDIGVYPNTSMTLTGREGAVRLLGIQLSPDIFPMLGAQPILGRTFEPAEEMPGADAVVILSHATWAKYFGANPNVQGQFLTLDGRAYTVIGVMSEDFQFPDPLTEFWIPFVMNSADPAMARRFVTPIARLKDGVTMAAAASEVSAILRELRKGLGSPARFDFVRMQDQLVAPVRPALRVLMAAVGLVLLIACVNVANLMLARTAARQREIAVRSALGAGRSRLVRQALTESVTIALIGGFAGTVLAFGGIQLLRTLGATIPRRDLYLGTGVSLPRLGEVSIDHTVLLFTIVVSVLTGVVFGLAPALRHSRSTPVDTLREGAASAISGFSVFRRLRIQGILVIAEIAMALMVFIGGALLMRSFVRLANVDPGYDRRNLVWFQTFLPRERSQSGPQTTAYGEGLVERLQSVPGVRAAGYAVQLPMGNLLRETSLRTTPELPTMTAQLPPGALRPGQIGGADVRAISRGFLAALGVRLIAGRGFEANDRVGQPQVMLINQTLAMSGVLGEKPIGRHIYALGREPWEIVGIVDDIHQFGLEREPGPQVFIDFRQLPAAAANGLYVAVRTESRSTPVTAARGIASQLDPAATLDRVGTMEELISNSFSRQRLYAVLLGAFAAVAVALAVIGIYGVLAYSVTQRAREIGIRMALGARPFAVVRLVLGQTLVLTTIGIVLGLAGAVGFTRYLQAMLFGVTPQDPVTFFAVALTFATVALVAAYMPAQRATKIDPLTALRGE